MTYKLSSIKVNYSIADELYSVFHLVETTPKNDITQAEVLVSGMLMT